MMNLQKNKNMLVGIGAGVLVLAGGLAVGLVLDRDADRPPRAADVSALAKQAVSHDAQRAMAAEAAVVELRDELTAAADEVDDCRARLAAAADELGQLRVRTTESSEALGVCRGGADYCWGLLRWTEADRQCCMVRLSGPPGRGCAYPVHPMWWGNSQ